MTTQHEKVVCIYDEGKLVGVLKRDEITGKKIVYMTGEADIDEIATLINPEHTQL